MNEIIKMIEEKLAQQNERIELLQWQNETLKEQLDKAEKELAALKGAKK